MCALNHHVHWTIVSHVYTFHVAAAQDLSCAFPASVLQTHSGFIALMLLILCCNAAGCGRKQCAKQIHFDHSQRVCHISTALDLLCQGKLCGMLYNSSEYRTRFTFLPGSTTMKTHPCLDVFYK